jgi:zeta-carotene desaturase
LTNSSKNEVIELALKELKDFFPRVAEARLERAHVVKEVRATFSAACDLEERRPRSETPVSNLFLAGDWTRSGWPATMEGAVRSGYLVAEAALRKLGSPTTFLIPDQR